MARRQKRPPVPIGTQSLEREYTRALLRVIGGVKAKLNHFLLERLPEILASAGTQMQVKADDAADDVQRIMRQLRASVDREYTDAELEAIARRAGVSVSTINKRSVSRQWKRVAGIDIFASEPWLKPQLANFAAMNASLISSIPEQTISQVESLVFQGLQSGTRYENLAEDIAGRFGVAENRAKLIARDQISKLNGQLTQLRQTNNGVTKYIWRTSQDERVRESHADLEGTTQSWDDPPSVDGESVHPGEAINCRCYAEPVFDLEASEEPQEE